MTGPNLTGVFGRQVKNHRPSALFPHPLELTVKLSGPHLIDLENIPSSPVPPMATTTPVPTRSLVSSRVFVLHLFPF